MKFIPQLDFYSFMGLKNFASLEEVKKRYRVLAMVNHPDRGGNLERMKRINHIYDIFKGEKEVYDSWLRQQLAPKIMREFVPGSFVHSNIYGGMTGSATGNAWTFNFTF